jgi:hypothetical protein
MIRPLLLAGFAVTLCLPCSSHADWTSYRGPLQNGVSSEKMPSLAAGELRPLWKTNVGIGTSSIVVKGERAYTMGNVRDKDVVFCLEAGTGREVWKYEYQLGANPRQFEGGSASTPTIDGNRL